MRKRTNTRARLFESDHASAGSVGFEGRNSAKFIWLMHQEWLSFMHAIALACDDTQPRTISCCARCTRAVEN